MSRAWLGDKAPDDTAAEPLYVEWFEQPEPLTEQMPAVSPDAPIVLSEDAPDAPQAEHVCAPTRLATEEEHRAALAELDLPSHPLTAREQLARIAPSHWYALNRWLLEVATIALGFTLGACAVVLILGYAVWLVR